MLTGKMPAETFPDTTECFGAEDTYYTQHIKYKVFPCVFLVEANAAKPSAALTSFEEAVETTQAINAGILINASGCALHVGQTLDVKNYIEATYVGRLPLSFYGPPTPKGERFKLVITNNNLDERVFAKEEDLTFNTGSRDKTTFYSSGR